MLDEKDLQAIDALLARRLGVVLESDIIPRFEVLHEQVDIIKEKMATREQLDALEERMNERFDVLEAVVKAHTHEISLLKKAQ